MALSLHGKGPTNVFQLIGNDENSASFALGWTFEQSPQYRRLFIEAVFEETLDVKDVLVALQQHRDDKGYTDVELQHGHRFHVILEAKKSWEFPSVHQLTRYIPRLVTQGAEKQKLVTVSAAHRSHALRRLPNELQGIGLTHFMERLTAFGSEGRNPS